MNTPKIDIEDMGSILFKMLGGIQTQNGRIVKGMLQKIKEQQGVIDAFKLKEKKNVRQD